jgi:hypothetical protein
MWEPRHVTTHWPPRPVTGIDLPFTIGRESGRSYVAYTKMVMCVYHPILCLQSPNFKLTDIQVEIWQNNEGNPPKNKNYLTTSIYIYFNKGIQEARVS